MLTLTAPDTIAAYIRVSTSDQKTESQREEISRWLRNHGIDPESIRWFEDKETGKTLKRPGFQKLQQAIFAGEIHVVIVYKVDRLARRMREGMNTVADWLKQDIRIIFVTQQIDLNGTIGEMLIALLFGFAQMELEFEVVASFRSGRNASH
jgi:DNA invertase Pin-like site-specific DNA recombinase